VRSDEEILSELRRAADGLWYMSESDYPFEAVMVEGAEEPSRERLREVAGESKDAPVETRRLEEFFRDSAGVRLGRAGTGEPPTPASFEGVLRALRENLTDIRVYRIGSVNIAVYVLGRSRSGNHLGLRTRVVET
jgi:Nuclease A inhibitor-like protein